MKIEEAMKYKATYQKIYNLLNHGIDQGKYNLIKEQYNNALHKVRQMLLNG